MHILVRILRRNWVRDVHLAAIHKHGHPTICRELRLDVCLPLAILLSPASTTIAVSIVVWPSVPSSLREAIAIVLNDVHLHTRWLPLALDVAIVGSFEVAGIWRDRVEVVIHTSVSSARVHVELHIPTKQVEGLSSMHAAIPRYLPTRTIPARSTEFEVIL